MDLAHLVWQVHCAAGSSADPLVDSRFLCLTGIGHPCWSCRFVIFIVVSCQLLWVVGHAAGSDGSAGDPLVDTSLLMLTPFGHPQTSTISCIRLQGYHLLFWGRWLVVHGKHEGVLGQQARLVGLECSRVTSVRWHRSHASELISVHQQQNPGLMQGQVHLVAGVAYSRVCVRVRTC